MAEGEGEICVPAMLRIWMRRLAWSALHWAHWAVNAARSWEWRCQWPICVVCGGECGSRWAGALLGPGAARGPGDEVDGCPRNIALIFASSDNMLIDDEIRNRMHIVGKIVSWCYFACRVKKFTIYDRHGAVAGVGAADGSGAGADACKGGGIRDEIRRHLLAEVDDCCDQVSPSSSTATMPIHVRIGPRRRLGDADGGEYPDCESRRRHDGVASPSGRGVCGGLDIEILCASDTKAITQAVACRAYEVKCAGSRTTGALQDTPTGPIKFPVSSSSAAGAERGRPPLSPLDSYFKMAGLSEEDHDIVIIFGDVFSFDGTSASPMISLSAPC